MRMSCRAANSIDSLLLTTGVQISGRGCCTGRGHSATSWYDQNLPWKEKTSSVQARVTISKASSKRAREFGQRDVVHLIFARDAAGEAGDQAAVRQAVEHRQFFGQAQRFVQRQQVAVDQQFDPFRALRGGGGHQVGRVHQPVRRAVMLVEAETVVAEPVDQFPGVEMLGVGADRDLGSEMAAGSG